uniref:Kinesin motor domain-containing protein n=1 Tax=Ascaris lumbricoides TaxID=6252 RepID=A0A0M3HWZ7_ASCLU
MIHIAIHIPYVAFDPGGNRDQIPEISSTCLRSGSVHFEVVVVKAARAVPRLTGTLRVEQNVTLFGTEFELLEGARDNT